MPLGVKGCSAGDEPVMIPGDVGASLTMRFTSRWFLAYTFALLICAPTCAIYRTLVDYLGPRPATHAEYVRHRATADRIIAAALPPGWAIRSGLYITTFDNASTRRGYAYIRLTSNGRPLLTAGFHGGSAPAPASWDFSDPESPGRFRAWLAGMIRPCGEMERAK